MVITNETAVQLGLTESQAAVINNMFAFVRFKTISELQEAEDPFEGYFPIDKGNGELEKIKASVFYQLIGNVAAPISPSDPAPTAKGWYKPQISSELDKPSDPNSTVDWGAKYPNAGNLRAKSGYDTLFYFNGVSAWKKTEVKLPGNTAKQDFDPTNNTDPSTMKAAADRWDKTIKVLKSFVEPLDTTIWEPMDFPAGESDNKLVNINFGEVANPYAKYGVIQASSLGNATKLKLKGSLGIFGNSIAWWIGQRPNGSRVVLKSGVISSGVAEIDIDPQFSSYIYSRSKGDSTLEKQPKVVLPIEEDAVMKKINLMSSGYSGVLDLASLGLKETNTAAQNTAIINTAIESQAGKSDAKHIKFPGGSFAVNEIVMKPGTALSGAGRIHTRLYTPEGSTARFIINIQDGQRARGQISDIFIDARNTKEGAIYLNNVYNFNFDNMVIYGTNQQYLVWIKGGLMHTMRNIYMLGAEIGLKTTHLTAFASNLCTYDNIFFVQQIKKCVELNAGSNYRFTSCVFEDSGISGDETTGGIHAIGLSPYGEGVDISINNCWSEGVRGGYIFKFENCRGNSVIRDSMMGNGGNGAGTIANAVINLNSRLLLSGSSAFSGGSDFKPFPTNIRAVGGFTYVDNPNIQIGTNNVGTIQKAQYS